VALVIGIFNQWAPSMEELGFAWEAFLQVLSDAWGQVKEFGSNVSEIFTSLKDAVGDSIDAMASYVGDKISGMVDGAVDKIKWLYETVVGHSIIPDMVKKVGVEMSNMAADGKYQADRFAANVTESLEGAEARASMYSRSNQGGGTPTASGSSKTTNDYRYATFNDGGRDMSSRMNRAGAGLQGW